MTNRSDGEALLQQRVNEAVADYTTYPKNYTELKEVVQERYGVTWKHEIENIITAARREQNPNYPRSNAVRQVNRYEAFLRGEHTKEVRNPNKPMGAMKTALQNAGKDYPKRDAPPDGFTITVKGTQGTSRHGSSRKRNRDFSHTFTYSEARDFVQQPSLGDLFARIYPKQPDMADILFGEDSAALDNVSITVS